MKNKKAQMEIIGLVVIVILISLGMLFLLQFALKENPEKKIFTRKGLAYSTVGSLMKTTISPEAGCVVEYAGVSSPQIDQDLFDDCAKYYYTFAESGKSGFSQYHCRGKENMELHSCGFLQEQIGFLLNETLGGWHKRYEFRSELLVAGQKEPTLLLKVESNRGNCQRSKEVDSSGPFNLNTEVGMLENTLDLCE